MIVSFLVGSCLVYGTTASTTMLRVPRTTYRFPIEYIPVEGETRLSGVGIFNTTSTNIVLLNQPLGGPSDDEPISILARGISIGYDSALIDFDRPMQVSSDEIAIIGGAPTSGFAQSVSNFLLTPISESDAFLVFNPLVPAEYAYEGSILYAPISSTSRSSSLSFRGSFRLRGNGGPDMTFPVPFAISVVQSRFLKMPGLIRSELLRRIDELGIRTSHRYGFFIRLYDFIADQLASLPIFDIIIQSDDGITQFRIGQLKKERASF